MKKKVWGIIGAVIAVLLIIGGVFYFKEQNKQKEQAEKAATSLKKLEEVSQAQENLLAEIEKSWDEKDQQFVAATLKENQLKTMAEKVSSLDQDLPKAEPKEKGQQAAYKTIVANATKTKTEFEKLQVAFQTTDKVNKLYEKPVIVGSQVTTDGKANLKEPTQEVKELIEKETLLNQKLKTTLSQLVAEAQAQIEENTQLQQQVALVAEDGQFKADVTVESLTAFEDYLKNVKYPYLKENYQTLIAKIPEKKNSLKPSLKKMSKEDIERRVFALFNPEGAGTADTAVANGMWNEDKFWVDILAIRPMTDGISMKALVSYEVQDNGDYKGTFGVNKTGNIFKDVTEEVVKKQRKDLHKPVFPQNLTEKDLITALKSVTPKENEFAPEYLEAGSGLESKPGYLYAHAPGGFSVLNFRYNLNTGEVSTLQSPGSVMKITDESWIYHFDATMAMWQQFPSH